MAETVQLVAMERVDGMGNACADGSYVRFVLLDNDAKRQTFKTSIGAAETLVHEIDGILGRSASKGNTEPVGYVTREAIDEVAAGRVGNHLFPAGTLQPENEVAVYAHPPSATTISDEQLLERLLHAHDFILGTMAAPSNKLNSPEWHKAVADAKSAIYDAMQFLEAARIRPIEADKPPYLSREYYDQWSTE